MRPSGKFKRFISNADYQVDDEQTRIPRNFDCLQHVGSELRLQAAFPSRFKRRVSAELKTLRKLVVLPIKRCCRSTSTFAGLH
jgi:hypothetical protein